MTKYVKLANGTLEYPPVNKQIENGFIFNYNVDIERLKADGFKEFVEAQRDINKSYRVSYQEAEEKIVEVLEDITSELEAQQKEAEVQRQINEIKAQLDEIDRKTIRPLRAGEIQRVEELEVQAVQLRAQLNQFMEVGV